MRNSNLTCSSLSTASMLIFHLLLEIVKRVFKSDALGSISNLFVCWIPRKQVVDGWTKTWWLHIFRPKQGLLKESAILLYQWFRKIFFFSINQSIPIEELLILLWIKTIMYLDTFIQISSNLMRKGLLGRYPFQNE